MRILKLPEIWFLVLAFIYVFLGYLGNKGALDVNVHDTYFITGHDFLFYFVSVYLFIQSAIYWSIRKLKGKNFNFKLALSHWILFVISFISPILGFVYLLRASSPPDFYPLNDIIMVGAGIHVFGLLIFIVNIIITVKTNGVINSKK